MLIFFGALMALGLFFIVSAVVGVVRSEDDFQMLHMGAINDMLGVPLFLAGFAGACFLSGQSVLGVKSLLLVALMYIAVPIAGYVVIKVMFFLQKEKE